jgi:hypothetical protein
MRQVTGRGAARSPAHEVQQSLAEVRALWAPLETARWVEADGGMFQRVWRSYARRLGTLCEAQMTLKRLQTQLLGTRWRRRTAPASGAAEASEEAVGRGEAGSARALAALALRLTRAPSGSSAAMRTGGEGRGICAKISCKA